MTRLKIIASTSRRNWRIAASGAALSVLALAPAFADAGAVLPPGPKENLAAWADGDVAGLKSLLALSKSAEEFRADLDTLSDERALATLAGYLALNTPLDMPGDDVPALIAALPLDGKELFVQNCLSCHGGDRYFLQQDKSAEDWMGIFDAPYHRRLLTEGMEREIFADYAAATTPLTLDPVPEDLSDDRNQ